MELGADMRMSVGALASASGLTVRTLHHWDAIGLLVPSERTGAGHRRYTAADVRRLYRVLALQRLGLPLREIAAVIEREGPDLRRAVAGHLDRVEADLERGRLLRDRLVRLLSTLDASDEAPGTELIETIEVMTMYEQHYTPEQLAELSERADALGPEGMERAQRDWAQLIDEVRMEMERGTDVTDPRVQALAGRWEALIEQFTGGDPGIRAGLQSVMDAEGPEAATRSVVDQEVMAYAARAMAARS
jgi:MerR family transcriptional regulator, thiopeptide resistance regulator